MPTHSLNLMPGVPSITQPHSQTIKPPKFEALEGLRGYCALAVLLSHVIYGPDETVSGLSLLTLFAPCGHVAVLIFFVLSGFVIGYTTPPEFSLRHLKTYLAKRFIRLYPIYLICLIPSFWLSGNVDWMQLAGHLIFMQGWFVPLIQTNTPLWSLHCEALFYLLFVGVWKFKLDPLKVFYVCILCGLINLFFKWHIFKLLGYFSIWIFGFWIAKNRESLSKLHPLDSTQRNFGFWSAIFLSLSFISVNAIEIILMNFHLKNDDFAANLPSVIGDIVILGLTGSILTSTMGYRIPGLKISQAIAFLSVAIAVGYALWKGILPVMQTYQTAFVFLALAVASWKVNTVPVNMLKQASYLGSISYALYLIHRPIQIAIYDYLDGETGVHAGLPNFWPANICFVLLSIGFAILLERYFQPWISVRLKQQLNIT